MSDDNLYAPPEAEVETPEYHPFNLAGRGARLGAAIIDGIVLSLIFWPIVLSLGYWESIAAATLTVSDSATILLISIAVFLIAQGFLLATRGQTIGKLLVGVRIVSVTDGKILPLPRLFLLRYLPIYVLSQVPLVGPIGNLVNVLFIFREDRRCVHDLIAGTRVVMA